MDGSSSDTRDWIVDDMLQGAPGAEGESDTEGAAGPAEDWSPPVQQITAQQAQLGAVAPDNAGERSGPVSDEALAALALRTAPPNVAVDADVVGDDGATDEADVTSVEDQEAAAAAEEAEWTEPTPAPEATSAGHEPVDAKTSAELLELRQVSVNARDEALEARGAATTARGEAQEARDSAVEEASKAASAQQMATETAEQVKRFAEQSAEAHDSVRDLESEVRRMLHDLEQKLQTVRERVDEAGSAANASRAAAERTAELEEAMQGKATEIETRAGKIAEEAARKEIEGGLSRIAEMAATEATERQRRRMGAAESKRASRASEQQALLQSAISGLQERLESIEEVDPGGAIASLTASLQKSERELGAAVVAMEKRLDGSDSAQAPLSSSLEHLSSQFKSSTGEHATRMDEIETAQTESIDALETRLAQTEKSLRSLAARIARAPEPRTAPSAPAKGGRLALNDATFEDLRALELSVTQAARVVARRGALRGFTSLDQLDEIPGIPPDARRAFKAHVSL